MSLFVLTLQLLHHQFIQQILYTSISFLNFQLRSWYIGFNVGAQVKGF